jgi:acyl-CoA reductase-like NAD-dependent aldehyde dehydrogenase
MTERFVPMLVGGADVEAIDGERTPILNPASAHVIASVPAAKAADVERAVEAATLAFAEGPWPRMSGGDRARVLNRFADILESHHDELSRAEAENNGRPIAETRAQLGILPEHFRYHASLATTARGETVPVGDGYLCYLQDVPLGVVAVMSPFNHPLLITARGMAPALAAGNTVVVKPSEFTPLTTLRLGSFAKEAGFPPGVVNVVTGVGAEAGAALVGHPDVARIEFTGGVETGRKVLVAAASRFGAATAELGGKAPVLVFDDADLMAAAQGAVFGGFIAAGQTCIAGARILVHEDVKDEFTDRLVSIVHGIRLGDPSSVDTQMGPLVSAAARDRVLNYIAVGVDEGATVLTGGAAAELDGDLANGFFVEPTVLDHVEPSMRVSREEIFGPVVTVDTFGDEAEAISKANDSRFGLGATVWTRDVARAHRVAQAVTAGIIWVNDHHRLSAAMPWGGFKDSGVGRQAGIESFRTFTEVKSIVVRIADGAPGWFTDGETQRLN